MIPASSPKIVCEGIAKGVLCGGNFNTLCVLGGTEYFPDFTNAELEELELLKKNFAT